MTADTDVTYRWTVTARGTGTNATDNTVDTRTGTETITVRNVSSAPVFNPDTGDPHNFVVGTAIASIQIPESTGNPAPTYTASGLPTGLTFSANTRIISGTPSAAGVGTIVITATNSEGSDMYMFGFQVAAVLLPDTFREVIASFVADEAVLILQAAADEIGGPVASQLHADAARLIRDVPELGRRMDSAMTALTGVAKLEDLAFNALSTYPPVLGTTKNRNQQRRNQAAIIDFVRALATIRFAERVGIEEYRDRLEAVANRDSAGDALDQRETGASTATFRALRALRSAVFEHVRNELMRLPPLITATPSTVQPSLVVSYDVYETVDRADEIVGRAQLSRPGFVPANPIVLPGE